MKTYSELLKHPKWQKKRLEILDRDGFQCRACWENSKTLHVHHTYYDKDLKPWEYPNNRLLTLCEDCHKLLHVLEKLDFGMDQICVLAKCLSDFEYEDINKWLKDKGYDKPVINEEEM